MRRTRPTWVVPTAVLLAGTVLLVARLGQPADLVFDEVYYVSDARAMLASGVEDGFAVHPPLGKWLIAAGIALAGDAPFGWRLSGALAGAVTAMLVALVVRRLAHRDGLAGLAGLLLLLDGVFLVQARTAMLDVHLALFVVLGAWLLLRDRDRQQQASAGPRWWLLAAGAAFGAAVAVKWSGALALVGAGVLVLVWETARARGSGRRALPAFGRATGTVAAYLGVVAVAVYALSWAPWLVAFEHTFTGTERGRAAADAGHVVGDRFGGLVRYHRQIADFHLKLDADHPYRAPASTWPLQLRPVVYHYEACGPDGIDGQGEPCVGPDGLTSEVVAVGNLALWWGALVVLPVTVAAAVRRDRRAGLPLALLAAQFLPWLVVARPIFSFYATPLVPFLVVAVAVGCDHLDRPARRVGLLAGTLAGAGVTAALSVAIDAASAVEMDPSGVAVAALAGGLLGAAAGTAVDLRSEARSGGAVPGARHGSALVVVLALIAVTLFVYFAPVWYGLPLPDEAIRARWWFDGWV